MRAATMNRRIPRRAIACAVVLGLIAATFTVTAALGGSRARAGGATQVPFAVLMCRLKDDHAWQKGKPFFKEMFTEAGAGMDGVFDYFLDNSQGMLSIAGTEVFGPFDVPITPEQDYVGAHAPGLADPRAWRIENCIKAADADVNFSGFAGIVALYNSGIESGATWATLALDGTTKSWPLTILDPGGWNVAWAAQEMGHGILPSGETGHSRSVKDPNKDYGDPYDVMSGMTGNEYQHSYFIGAHIPRIYDAVVHQHDRPDWDADPSTWTWSEGMAGPSLAIPWRYEMGWLNSSQVATVTSDCQMLTLRAVNEPQGLVGARIPVSDGRSLFVEFRSVSGWDRDLPRDTVLIHELRPGDVRPWLVDVPDAEWLPGELYADPSSTVRISVESINTQARTATVKVYRDVVESAQRTTGSPAADVAVPSVVGDGAALGVDNKIVSPVAAKLIQAASCPPQIKDIDLTILEVQIPKPLPDPTAVIGRVPLPSRRLR